MAEIKGLPLINQLSNPTFDGRKDLNKEMNCVIASLLSIILYYHPEYQGKISDDIIKNAVYGTAYTGGTDITRFLAYAGVHGVAFSRVSGTNTQLVAAAHKAIDSGHPAIGTQVDPYVNTNLPQFSGWLHSFTFYAESPGTLTIMDPFGGKLVEKSDSEWDSVLRTGSIWIASNNVVPRAAPIAAPLLSPITRPVPVPVVEQATLPVAAVAKDALPAHLRAAGWTDDGTRLWPPNHLYPFVQGFRDAVLKAGAEYDPADWSIENANERARLEESHPELGGGMQQLTVLGGMNWNQTHGVFPLAAGEEIQKNRAQIAALYTALDKAKTDITILLDIIKKNGIVLTGGN